MFGWNLPPGCSVNDILGNRPEDEAWEKLIEAFWQQDRFTAEEWELSDDLDATIHDIITKAIEYGMDVGKKEQRQIDAENKFYEERGKEEQNAPKQRTDN